MKLTRAMHGNTKTRKNHASVQTEFIQLGCAEARIEFGSYFTILVVVSEELFGFPELCV